MPLFNRARIGDEQISTADWNGLMEMAREWQRGRFKPGRQGQSTQFIDRTIRIRNDSGSDCPRFGVLGLMAPLIPKANNAAFFFNQIALSATTPAADHAGRFAVAAQPITAGSIGRAWIDGVCLTLVEMADEEHSAATVSPGATRLISSAEGEAALLWIEPVEQRDVADIAWCIIRIGNSGGASSGTSLGFCRIESVIGTSAPYLYTARHATPDGSGGFNPIGSDFDVRNVDESGPSGAGVYKLQVNDVVPYWQGEDGDYYCTRSNYRGTY